MPGSDAIDRVLERKTRRRTLWSGGGEPNWDGNTLFTLIEVFGELVARPRVTWYDTSSHYLVYGDFNVTTGVALYRFWVNDLLDRAGVPVGAEYSIRPGYATSRYSWITPPRISLCRRRVGSGSIVGSGRAPKLKGDCCCRPR